MNYLYFIRKYNLKPGDRLVVPKSSLRIVQHHAIYLGYGPDGIHWMIENKIGFGVRLIRASSFLNGNPSITRIVRFQGDGYDRKVAVQRALREIGKPYDLINYNCEHFANKVQFNRPTSGQVGAGVGIFLGLALLLLLSGSD